MIALGDRNYLQDTLNEMERVIDGVSHFLWRSNMNQRVQKSRREGDAKSLVSCRRA
jgi:hypothetical protein